MEIWKEIEGYENLYQISNHGRVKSLNYRHTGKEKIRKPTKRKDGYLKVVLFKQGKRKNYQVHRLVAQAFIDNSNNLPEINHRDEVKTNNCASNLEWCTNYYNINYGTRNQRVAESNTNNPNTSKQVLCVETGKTYPSTHQVQRELGFNQGHISSTCNGKRNTCGGFHWRYV